MCKGEATLFGEPETTKGSHLVPAKTMTLLERNLTDDGELIRVALRPNEAIFKTERSMIYTRLVEGRYPPYKEIIPKKTTMKVSLPVPVFLSKVRQAAIMTDDESKRVDLSFEPGKLTMKARGVDTGSSEVEMLLEGFTGPQVKIAFDPHYLTEFLRAIDGEPTVMLEMTDETKPALFRVGEDYLYLVMPLS
jgi:DNA polymerase-3 subunit beta